MDTKYMGYALAPCADGKWERCERYGPISLLDFVRQAVSKDETVEFYDLDVESERELVAGQGLVVPGQFRDRAPDRLLCLVCERGGLRIAHYHGFDRIQQKTIYLGPLQLEEIDRCQGADGSIEIAYRISAIGHLGVLRLNESVTCEGMSFAIQIKR